MTSWAFFSGTHYAYCQVSSHGGAELFEGLASRRFTRPKLRHFFRRWLEYDRLAYVTRKVVRHLYYLWMWLAPEGKNADAVFATAVSL